MNELLEWIEYIEENADSRQQRKVRHRLKDIIVIVLFAMLANADDWVEIGIFAAYHEEYLRKYIRLENGVPSHDTIQRVMAIVSPEIMQQIITKWQEVLNSNEGESLRKIIAVDGKTMRGNTQNGSKPSHIVSAWCDEDGFCLGQVSVEEKSNEITAIPELLNKINIKGQIITIDAMGTQTEIAEKIVQKRADYVLALKGNQSTLHDDVKEYFQDKEREDRKLLQQRIFEEAKQRAELEKAKAQEEEAKLKAEAEAKAKAEEEERLKAEAEAKAKAEEEARLKAEAEKEAQIRAEVEAKVRAEIEARIRAEAEAEAKAKAEVEARRKADAEAKAEEEARIRAEAMAKAAEEAKAKEESAKAVESEPPKRTTKTLNPDESFDDFKEFL